MQLKEQFGPAGNAYTDFLDQMGVFHLDKKCVVQLLFLLIFTIEPFQSYLLLNWESLI